MPSRSTVNFWHWLLTGPALRTQTQVEEGGHLVIRLPEQQGDREAGVIRVAVLWPLVTLLGLLVTGTVLYNLAEADPPTAGAHMAVVLVIGVTIILLLDALALRGLRERWHDVITVSDEVIAAQRIHNFFALTWTTTSLHFPTRALRRLAHGGSYLQAQTTLNAVHRLTAGYSELEILAVWERILGRLEAQRQKQGLPALKSDGKGTAILPVSRPAHVPWTGRLRHAG